ncbi:CshA/CshB family fibrillar adhesin-related protein [Qipengyuania sediminis]|uniref:CshA/CshB family fibrillar adhesin-related protein n=1 Tax=Qipengyuania sediminis TaxID=1532023 RepID=UPI001F0E8A1D|nr:CshA/CshB family fibrillar adhesin-related protein [Qipengyuania sediminis]
MAIAARPTSWLRIAAMRLFALIALLTGAPALAANCNIATSQGTTGPADWQTYCWLDLASYSDTTARTTSGQAFSYTLPDGTLMTFRLRVTGPALAAATAPSWTGAAVGNTAFLGIAGRPILYQGAAGTNVITISNITLTPPAGGTVTSYMFVGADAESSNEGESLTFQTNGGPWSVIGTIGPISGNAYPGQSGAGTTSFTVTGVPGTVGAYIVGSPTPTQVTTTMVGGGLQGTMFAVRFASITLNTVIQGARADPTDQFTFSIAPQSGGTAYASGSTSGTGLGPFTAASLPTSAALPLRLTQAMTSGSVNELTHYRSSLTCSNTTTSSTTPLPSNVLTDNYAFGSLQYGDRVSCTFTQTPFPHFRLSKAIGTGGRQFATDQFRMEIAQGATVLATTTTGGTGTTVTTGVTSQVQGVAGTAYTLREIGAGSTSLAQYNAVMACTNAFATSSTVLPAVPGSTITPQMGDVIACTITNTRRATNATLAITKLSAIVSDPIRSTTNPLGIPGALVRYTIQISNSGPAAVTANSVFVLDGLPSQIEVGSAAAATFTQGTPTSGLTFTPATDLRFSNATTAPASFAACTYTPVAAYDPAVRYVCLNPKGTMAGSTGTPPSFTISFDARVK